MMIPRYVRSSIAGGCTSLLFLGLAGYGGFRLYQDYHSPYKLVNVSGQHYLLEKHTERQKLITKGFELGTLDERLKGIAAEPKESVWKAIERLRK